MVELLNVALAQIAPVWLNKQQTCSKILQYISDAGNKDCDLIIFPEAILPGYPFWLSLTDGASFNSKHQKEIHAHYASQAMQVDNDEMSSICRLAAQHQIAIYLGMVERPVDRGGHSLYCSLVFISKQGEIKSVHRKLQPTYEERLTWSPGDGHGLIVHELEGFHLGGLNCWENWMPLSRTALYGQGENVHVAVWPGCLRNTKKITRFIAEESRSYVISVSGIMRQSDFPQDTPHLHRIVERAPEVIADGGSCIAAPDGTWHLKPVTNKELLLTALLPYSKILEERQNFDVVGHYSRPDVTQLIVNHERQRLVK